VKRTLALLLGLIALSALPACGSRSADQCTFSADCAEPREFCDASTLRCVAYECIEDAMCSGTRVCNMITNTCERPAPPRDMGQDMAVRPEDMSADMPDEDEDMPPEDMTPTDMTPPEVVGTMPAAGSEIARDQTFTITFSEPLDPISVSEFSLALEDAAGNELELDITYDDDVTATVTPKTMLELAQRYTLVIKTFVRDPALNSLAEEVRVDFFSPFVAREDQRMLAEKWAPTIYQEIRDVSRLVWRNDLPTSVDFDGDFDASNNRENMLVTASDHRARVYYHITESRSQYFIVYAMYYPTRAQTLDMTTEFFEHDFTGAVFVVDKDTDRLLLVEGLRVSSPSDELISYMNSDGGITLPGDDQIARGTFSDADLEDGNHYPMYIPDGRHEACNWLDGAPQDPLPTCRHPRGEFKGGPSNGVVMRPGAAQTINDAVMNPQTMLNEMTYELIPLAGLFWLRRGEVGESSLFSQVRAYRPAGMRPTGAPDGQSLILPVSLNSNDAMTFGKTPFRWLVRGTANNDGQWLLDPAWSLIQRYMLPFGITWELNYCENLFLGIDERGSANCQ